MLSTDRVRNAVDDSVGAQEKAKHISDVLQIGEFVFTP
jgi:hypothetical protein